jgi:hypothetical protein
MLWAFWALCHTFFYSSVNQLNRYWQIPGRILVRWRSLMPAVIMLPIIFFVPPPTSPWFYFGAVASGLMVLIHDGTMYDVSARYGAQVAFRIRPLVLPIVFILWLFLHPEQFFNMLDQPLLAGGLVGCLCLITYLLTRLTHCHVSRAAMKQMIPVLLTGIVFEITNKTAMDHATFPQNTLYYVFIVSGVPILLATLMAGKNMPIMLREMASVAKRGASVGSVVVLSMVSRNIAMILTPNPAYVTAISLSAPLWIAALMHIRGEKEEADWKTGTFLLLTILIMVFLAAEIKH